MGHLKLVVVDSKYCDYLRDFDHRVAYNKNRKELRPFVGVLFKVNDFEYFAPLSSPKKKHLRMKDTLDFMKIDNGKLGAINFNNMIPVELDNYKVVNFYDNKSLSKEESDYKNLLKDQLSWLNNHHRHVKNNARRLHDIYIKDELGKNIKARCCNFPLLEEKCKEYQTVLT